MAKITATVTLPDGSNYAIQNLLQSGKTNAKLAKNKGYRTLGLSLIPHKGAGLGNLCPHASEGCVALCINESGRSLGTGPIRDGILKARLARTLLFFQQRDTFRAMLRQEIEAARRLARMDGLGLIVRLNVFSDVDWPRLDPTLLTDYPDVLFYGYTKRPEAYARFLSGGDPSNYHLTFSRSETNEDTALAFLARGGHVTVVFDTKYSATSKHPVPTEWRGYPVIDGDETDLRFLDPEGPLVVGLRAKGKARWPEFKASGFVVKTGAYAEA